MLKALTYANLDNQKAEEQINVVKNAVLQDYIQDYVARKTASQGLGNPQVAAEQQDPVIAYSKQAIDAVLANKVDPRVVFADENVLPEYKEMLQELLRQQQTQAGLGQIA